MKIEIEGAIIKLIPENEREVSELNNLWELVARCEEENRKLLPLGVYVPGSTPYAQFYVEGLKVSTSTHREIRKIRYVCMVCVWFVIGWKNILKTNLHPFAVDNPCIVWIRSLALYWAIIFP